MFSYDGSKRPTVEELRAHPWMTKGSDYKAIRSDLVERLSSIRSEKTAASSNNQGEATRAGKGADSMLELVREAQSQSNLNNYMFNDKTDFETQCDPGYIHEKLQEFNTNSCDGALTIEVNKEKKWMKINREDKE